MSSSLHRWSRRFWGVIPLLLGFVLVWAAPKAQSGPSPSENQERPVKVRVIQITPLEVSPRLVGYGLVRAARTWEAVAEVAAPVVWLAESARSGLIVPEGTELIRLDDADYRLALAQVEAQLKAAEVRKRTTQASLLLAEKDLSLLKADYLRKQDLASKGAGAQNTVDAAERQMLNGLSQVQNLKHALDLGDAERGVLEAQKQAAQLSLKRTVIRAPFKVRLTEVKVGEMQYANRGQLLLTADGVDAVEVEARFAVGALRPLILSGGPRTANSAELVPGVMDLEARVRLKTATHTVEWSAQVSRVSGVIDAQTQSLGVVAAIQSPLEQAEPGNRPPLLRNTFVEVELRAKPGKRQMVLPRSAIRRGRVFVVNEENRLEIRPVEIQFSQGNYAVLKSGLQAGERLIVSDVLTPIESMLLEPQEDPKTKKALIAEATGKAPSEEGKKKGGPQ
jgi:hypothetical protein